MSDTAPRRRLGLHERISLTHAWPSVIIYAVLAGMLALLAILNPRFPSVFALTNIMSTALPLVFAGLAQTVVILIRGIDLSVGPTMSLAMVLAARFMDKAPGGPAAVIAFCLLAGLGVGLINGFFVVTARLQPIIVTLATSSILTGLALYILPQPGGYIPEGFNVIASGTLFGIPLSAIALAAVLGLLWFPLQASRLGQGWRAVGGNESGAYFSGLPVARIQYGAFAFSGLFSALGGLTLAFQTLTGDSMMGGPYTLNSIAAAVLGGVSLAGGRGGAIGLVGGVFVLTIAVDILFFLQVSAYYQYVFSGLIVIAALSAVTLAELARSRKARMRRAAAKDKTL